MAKFRWDPGSRRQFRENVKAYKQRRRRLFERGVASWADGTVGEMREELLRVKAFDQGILSAATGRTEPQWAGSRLSVAVYNPLEYASIIEWGRLPGKHPPLLPLASWAVRKGIAKSLPVIVTFERYRDEWAASGAILRNMKKGSRKGKSPPKEMDPIVRDLLIIRLIARKIQEKGSKGRHPFSRAWDRRARVFLREVGQVVDSGHAA